MSQSTQRELASMGKQIANCDAKTAYRDQAAAWGASEHVQRASRDRCRLKPYRCPVCGEWHLTSKGVG